MNIQELLKNYQIDRPKPKTTSERAELVSKFVEKLNEQRTQNGFSRLSPKFYAIKMAQSGLKTTQDLYWFYAYCNDAKDFGKCWWWSLKGKIE